MYPVVSRQFEYVRAPRAGQLAIPGSIAALTLVAVTPQAIDLRTFMSPADGSQDITQQTTTKKAPATESYLTVVAGAGDVGVIFGKALADVTAGNAPVLATVGSLTANVYNNAAGVAFYIPAKTSVRFKLDRGQDNFMGLIGAGGIVYFYQSSPTTDGV